MRIRVRRLLVLFPAAILVALGLAVWYLQSDRFQQFARTAIISRVEAATGMDCSIDRVALNIFRDSFRVEGITLRPKAGHTGPATVEAAEVSDPLGERRGGEALEHGE